MVAFTRARPRIFTFASPPNEPSLKSYTFFSLTGAISTKYIREIRRRKAKKRQIGYFFLLFRIPRDFFFIFLGAFFRSEFFSSKTNAIRRRNM